MTFMFQRQVRRVWEGLQCRSFCVLHHDSTDVVSKIFILFLRRYMRNTKMSGASHRTRVRLYFLSQDVTHRYDFLVAVTWQYFALNILILPPAGEQPPELELPSDKFFPKATGNHCRETKETHAAPEPRVADPCYR